MPNNITRFEEMMRFLPWYYQDSEIMNGIMQGDAKEIEALRAGILFVLAQLYVDTATDYGLKLWERELGITPKEGASIELRRAQIKAKLQMATIMTPKQIENIANLFTKEGLAQVSEVPKSYHFHIKVPYTDLKWPKELKEAINKAKPAHLGYDVILSWGRRFFLNCAGGVDLVEIPGREWTETQTHILFDDGLNAAGETETVTHTATTTTEHSDYVYGAGTVNGRLQLNRTGEFSREEKDMGGEVTERWSVFVGARINSRASLSTNNAAKEARSRTYHVADWQEVEKRHGKALNAAGGGKVKRWTTTGTRMWTEKRYKKPTPYYALNKAGAKTVTRQDVGEDVTVQEIIFKGDTTNGSKPEMRQAETTTTKITRNIIFLDGGRLNARDTAKLNAAESRQDSQTETTTKVNTFYLFHGATLNGGLKSNSGQHETRQKTIHIPKWRDVIKRSGATVTNNTKHHSTTVEIKHTVPGRIEKKFNPKRGTLLNNHAVLGYMTL